MRLIQPSSSSGGGMSIGGTVTSGTTGSILFIGPGPVLAQDNANLFWDDTNNRFGIGDATPDATLDVMQAAQTGTVVPAFLAMGGTHTSLTASTEYTDVYFNLSRTIKFVAGDLALQRSVRIASPTISATLCNFTTSTTVSIEGVVTASGSVQLLNTYALYISTVPVSTGNVTNAISLVVEAPTGAATTNAAAAFTGASGIVGINTLTPRVALDILPTVTGSSPTVVTQSGNTIGTELIVSTEAVTSTPAMFLIMGDFSLNPIASSSSNATPLGSILSLKGSSNFTGHTSGVSSQFRVFTTGGTITQNSVFRSTYITDSSSTGAITTARGMLATTVLAGTNAIGTYVGYEVGYSSTAATTTTDVIGFRFGLPTISGGAVITNVTAIDILDQTETVTTLKIGIRQRGTNCHNRLNGNISIGQDATPGATLDVSGRLFVDGATGKITKYNNITTVSGGVPSELATVDLTTQAAAIADTTLYTPTATGLFRVSIYLQVTRAATTSSILGGATGVVIKFNDGDGNVAQANTAALATTAGAIAVTAAGNTTGTNLEGTLVIYARTGVAITYAIGYTSVGITTMQYAAHLKVEAL